jgi:hypothetical protein
LPRRLRRALPGPASPQRPAPPAHAPERCPRSSRRGHEPALDRREGAQPARRGGKVRQCPDRGRPRCRIGARVGRLRLTRARLHSLPATGQRYLRLFVERQAEAQGKKLDAFFSKTKSYENVEDALDDVVDGAVKAAVSDRAGLEAFKRRKPGRFRQLKEIAQSKPFPPSVVAYYDSKIEDATLRQFRDGLLRASQTEKGQTMLTFFRLTGFEPVPSDFSRVLAETRKSFPPPKSLTE